MKLVKSDLDKHKQLLANKEGELSSLQEKCNEMERWKRSRESLEFETKPSSEEGEAVQKERALWEEEKKVGGV